MMEHGRDWMDYAQLASSLAQNAPLAGIGDLVGERKKAEFNEAVGWQRSSRHRRGACAVSGATEKYLKQIE